MPLGTLVSPSPILEDKIVHFHPLAGFVLGCYSWLQSQLLPKALLGDDHGVRGQGRPCVHPRPAQEPHPRAGVSALLGVAPDPSVAEAPHPALP